MRKHEAMAGFSWRTNKALKHQSTTGGGGGVAYSITGMILTERHLEEVVVEL